MKEQTEIVEYRVRVRISYDTPKARRIALATPIERLYVECHGVGIDGCYSAKLAGKPVLIKDGK